MKAEVISPVSSRCYSGKMTGQVTHVNGCKVTGCGFYPQPVQIPRRTQPIGTVGNARIDHAGNAFHGHLSVVTVTVCVPVLLGRAEEVASWLLAFLYISHS